MRFLELMCRKNLHFNEYDPVTIAFLGDSITQGCFEIYKGDNGFIQSTYDFDEVYHSRLRKLFSTIYPAVQTNLLNAGISGDTASGGLRRLERDVIRFSPQLVVACFGLNDVINGTKGIDEYGRALKEIFKKVKVSGSECIFMTPNMMNTYVDKRISVCFQGIAEEMSELQNSGIMDVYMECAKKICRNENIPVCDCYYKWKRLAELGVDTTALLSNYINHPTRDMHSLFASTLFDTIICEKMHG